MKKHFIELARYRKS